MVYIERRYISYTSWVIREKNKDDERYYTMINRYGSLIPNNLYLSFLFSQKKNTGFSMRVVDAFCRAHCVDNNITSFTS